MFMILFTSAKGGVGKSTLAVNFKHFLMSPYEANGHKVVLVDADPNGHLHGAAFLSRDAVQALPQKKETAEEALRRVLVGSGAAIAVVDSKPAMELGERYAISLADLVIVPVLPAVGEARATLEVIRVAQDIRQAHGDGFPRIAIAPNCWDKTSEAARAMETLQSSGETVLPPIYLRNTVRAAMREKGSVFGTRGMIRKEMLFAFWGALNLFTGGEIDARLK